MSFARDLKRYADKTKATLDEVSRAVTIQWFSDTIMATPVGNPSIWQSPAPPGYVGGAARANWQFSVGAPASGTVDAVDRSGSATIKKVQPVPGDVNYLTNNLPYILRLEYGSWSQQAPEGMARRSLANVRANVRKAVRERT